MKEKTWLQKLIKNLRKKIGNYLCPEPEKTQTSAVIIFTFDKVEGKAVSYLIDFGKTIQIESISRASELSKWTDSLYLDRFSIVPVKLDALRIFQKKGGKE